MDDLLDISRITRGLVELRKETVNLAEIADQAVEMVTPAIEGRRHELNLSLPRKALRVEGDAARLTQVVFNLLNNGAKYTDSNGRLRVAARDLGHEVEIEVEDNGIGIARDALGEVFTMFSQVEAARMRSEGDL